MAVQTVRFLFTKRFQSAKHVEALCAAFTVAFEHMVDDDAMYIGSLSPLHGDHQGRGVGVEFRPTVLLLLMVMWLVEETQVRKSVGRCC